MCGAYLSASYLLVHGLRTQSGHIHVSEELFFPPRPFLRAKAEFLRWLPSGNVDVAKLRKHLSWLWNAGRCIRAVGCFVLVSGRRLLYVDVLLLLSGFTVTVTGLRLLLLCVVP